MQTQAYQRAAASEETVLAFKRHILTESAGFAAEPEADLFRVNLLERMLNRYDELQEKGMGELSCRNRVVYEFADIAAQMRNMGFAEAAMHEDGVHSRWPQLTQKEAEGYIRERDAYLHKISLGVFLCTASLVPLMLCAALSEALYLMEDVFALLGLVGMFAMIGTGVYAMVTAVKPKAEKKICSGRFSLPRRLRESLTAIREKVEQKARKRRGRGVALCVTSVIPIFFGAILSEILYSDIFPIAGVAGMFVMIGMGVYELVMAAGERATMRQLLDCEKE